MSKNEELFEVTAMFQTFLKGISQDWNKHGFDLNITQFKVLYILNKHGEQKVSQLAATLGISSAAVTGITDQLLADGYLKKERAKQDRRVVNIILTSKGNEFIQEIQEKQNERMRKYFDILEEEDIQHLKRIFAALISNI